MRLKCITIIIFLTLSKISLALLPKPEVCPSVSDMKAVGIDILVEKDGYWYGGVSSANYDTNYNWTLLMGAYKAKDEDDAKSQMVVSLHALTFEIGPLPFQLIEKDSWICSYRDKTGHKVGTITPAMKYDHYIYKYL
ncbi:MAG: DUF4949 domain-containing protein [Legionella sp.]|nr:DUF4949 domain-containing protein [Legionella sp.]